MNNYTGDFHFLFKKNAYIYFLSLRFFFLKHKFSLYINLFIYGQPPPPLPTTISTHIILLFVLLLVLQYEHLILINVNRFRSKGSF